MRFRGAEIAQGQAQAILVAYDIMELDGEHVPGAAAGAQLVTFLNSAGLIPARKF
jgi:hypothetical protein